MFLNSLHVGTNWDRALNIQTHAGQWPPLPLVNFTVFFILLLFSPSSLHVPLASLGAGFPDLLFLFLKQGVLKCVSFSTKQPFNATRVTATEIADRVKELMKDNAIVPGKSGFWEEFDVRVLILISILLL